MQLTVDDLRASAPLGETGDTVRGIQSQMGGSADRPSATIVSRGKGGSFAETGTRPHIITPRNSKVLVFPGTSGRISQPGPSQRIATRGGGMVFATIVHHPGTPARQWFGPALERWETHLQQAGEATPF